VTSWSFDNEFKVENCLSVYACLWWNWGLEFESEIVFFHIILCFYTRIQMCLIKFVGYMSN